MPVYGHGRRRPSTTRPRGRVPQRERMDVQREFHVSRAPRKGEKLGCERRRGGSGGVPAKGSRREPGSRTRERIPALGSAPARLTLHVCLGSRAAFVVSIGGWARGCVVARARWLVDASDEGGACARAGGPASVCVLVCGMSRCSTTARRGWSSVEHWQLSSRPIRVGTTETCVRMMMTRSLARRLVSCRVCPRVSRVRSWPLPLGSRRRVRLRESLFGEWHGPVVSVECKQAELTERYWLTMCCAFLYFRF